MTRGSPADEDEWWSCRAGLRAGERHAPGLRWHCRDSYVLAPPSAYGPGLAARWLRSRRAPAAGRAAAAGVPRRRLRGAVLDHSLPRGPPRSEALFARARRGDSRRRELAGARVRRGRRRAPVHGPGAGPYLTDADGHEYVDLVCSWGPMILGHAYPPVVAAVSPRPLAAARRSARRRPARWSWPRRSSPRAPVEQVRLVNSGTEATMSALRLARGFTGRSLVVKFAGCYHGHVDALLAAAGSGVATFGLPDSPGVTGAAAARHAGAAVQRRRRRCRRCSRRAARRSRA